MLDSNTLFDENFYLAQNPDVARAVAAGQFKNGLEHFNIYGIVEERNPSAYFDSSYYLLQNPDVAAAVRNFDTTAFDHFLQFGQFEGRNPSPLFNPTWYARKNPDVAAAVSRDEFTGEYEHFVEYGDSEGRDPSGAFDTSYYLQQNPDVAAAVARDELTGFQHFVEYGTDEKRNPSPQFNTSFYLLQYPDVASAINAGAFDGGAIEHFAEFGYKEERETVSSFPLPDPTGPFEVGTTSYEFTDTSRDEILTPDPNDKRTVTVKIWYPGQANPQALGQVPPYLDNFGQLVAPAQGLPSDFYSWIDPNVIAATGVSSAQASYPVVLFSHGLGALPESYTAQLAELASHGYIVVGINHTGVSGVNALSDGRVVPFASSFVPANLQDFPTALAQIVGITAADTSFVLNQLTALNASDPKGLFAGRMDLNRVGMFGQSLGGVTTTAAMELDPRLQAGISLDGPILSSTLTQTPIAKPFMLINAGQTYSDTPVGQTVGQLEQRQAVYQKLTSAGYNVTIAGTEHSDFSDRSLLLPLISFYSPEQLGSTGTVSNLGLTDSGPIEGTRAHDIMDAYTVAFFDKHLKNQSQPLLAGASAAYPEVQFQSRNA